MIKEYCSVVGNIIEAYGASMDSLQEEIKTVDKTLEILQEGSIEQFGTTIHRKKLVEKKLDYQKKAEQLIDLENKLYKFLKFLYNSKSEKIFNDCDFIPIANYPVFANTKFLDLNKIDYNFDESGYNQDYYIKFPMGYCGSQEEMDALNKMRNTLRCNAFYKLAHIQNIINEYSTLIYHIASKTQVDKLSPKYQMQMKIFSKLAGIQNKTLPEVFIEMINKNLDKVKNVLIPEMAPAYYFAQVVMAFQEEVEFHKLRKNIDFMT